MRLYGAWPTASSDVDRGATQTNDAFARGLHGLRTFPALMTIHMRPLGRTKGRFAVSVGDVAQLDRASA
jgi:hypothetical protein